MRTSVVMLAALIACGRLDFNPTAEQVARPDAAVAPDADPASPDGPLGFGSYTVTQGTMTYVSPVGAQLVPGFANGADENTYGLQLPFSFTFYGIPYDSLTISVNGFVTFTGPPSGIDSYQNDC